MEFQENVSHQKWESILKESTTEFTYFFHTPIWVKILEESSGFKNATRLYDIDGTEVLIPMMKKTFKGLSTFHSMPIGYGGIFSSSSLDQRQLTGLCNTLVGGRRLWVALSFPPGSEITLPTIRRIEPTHSQYNYTHILFLDTPFDSLWKHRIKEGARKNVRRAERSNIEVSISRNLADFQWFYQTYKLKSAEWGYSQPKLPWEFFTAVWTYGHPYAILRLAKMRGEPIAAMLTFEYGNTAYGFLEVSEKRFNTFSPFFILARDVIENAYERGYDIFDFGSSGLYPEGVRQRKEMFGSVYIPVKGYAVISCFGRAVRLIRRLKFTVSA